MKEIDFNTVFNNNFTLLYNIASHHLRERDAEEAVADAFIAFWREKDKIKYTFGDCRNWLVGVLRNKIRDRIKSYKTEKHTFISHGWIDEDEGLDHVEDPFTEEMDYMEELKSALSILSKKERMVMALVIAGYPTEDIATKLGVSPQTARNQRVTAIKKNTQSSQNKDHKKIHCVSKAQSYQRALTPRIS